MPTNEEYLEDVNRSIRKATTDGTGVFDTGDLSTGGKLTDEQANRFLDIIHNQSALTKDVRNVRMNAPKRLIEKLGFQSRILVKANSTYAAPAATDVKVPSTDKVTLSTVEMAVFVDLAVDTLEDNIERDSLENSLIQRVAKRLAFDLEDLYLYGDEDLSTTAFLSANDGWFELVTSNDYNHASAAFSEDGVLGEMIEKLPGKYRYNLNEFRFYVPQDVELAIRRERAGRATGGGDAWLTSNAPLSYLGVPIVSVPALKNSADAQGNILLCHPQNLIVGVQRDISFHNFYNGRRRVWEMTWTMRTDAQIEYEDACVKGRNVAP